MRTIVPLLIALGICSVGTACTTDPEPTDETDVGESLEAKLHRYLTGDFSSEAQSTSNPAYFDIRMSICPMEAPSLGALVLYVEQAQAENLGSPYRQRLYLIEAGAEADTAISRIYTFNNPAAAVGACADASKLPSADGAVEKEGCAVTMTWDGSRWTGGTTGEDCPTTQGGDYATSEIVITDDQLTSWDRGFFDNGDQAWGAVGGGYEFDRLTDLPAE